MVQYAMQVWSALPQEIWVALFTLGVSSLIVTIVTYNEKYPPEPDNGKAS